MNNVKKWAAKHKKILLLIVLIVPFAGAALAIIFKDLLIEKINWLKSKLKKDKTEDEDEQDEPLYKNYNDEIGNGNSDLTRGQRNNNPLNIKHGNNWRGETSKPLDEVFESFEDVKYGIRAATIILGNYRKKHGLKTIRQIIQRWSATDQEPYILFISRKLGVSPEIDYDVTKKPAVIELIKAMHVFENGKAYLTEDEIREGVDLANID